MPLVRVDIKKNPDPTFAKRIGEVIYAALRSEINVPEHDNFQVLAEHDGVTEGRHALRYEFAGTPFESVQLVTPTSGTRDVATIVAAFGAGPCPLTTTTFFVFAS